MCGPPLRKGRGRAILERRPCAVRERGRRGGGGSHG